MLPPRLFVACSTSGQPYVHEARADSARTRSRKRLVFHVLWAEIKHVARVRMVDLQYMQTSAAQKRLQSRVLIRWYCELYAEQSSLATHAQLFEPHLGRTWDLRMRIGSVHGSRGCATASWALGKVEKLCLHMSRSSWSKVHSAVWSTPSVHVCLQLSRTSESGVGVSSEQSSRF